MDVLDRSVGGRLPRHRACFVEGVPAAADAVAILLAADDLQQFGGAVRRPGDFPASIMRRVGLTVGTKEGRSEEHTSELQSLMRISYAVFCLKQKKTSTHSAL